MIGGELASDMTLYDWEADIFKCCIFASYQYHLEVVLFFHLLLPNLRTLSFAANMQDSATYSTQSQTGLPSRQYRLEAAGAVFK